MTIKKEIKANVTYHPDGYRISHKCAICGKEMLPCGLTRKYCKKSCQKVGWFNAEHNTDYKTLEECKQHYINNNIPYRGRIEGKPVMQFTLQGKYIRTIPSTCTAKLIGDENGRFDKNSLARCARGERNTYRDYIWIYKEDYTEEVLQKRLEKVKKRFNSIEKPVVVFDENGNYKARYNSITEGAEKEFVDRTSLMGHLKRKARHNTCAGFVWYYEETLQQQQQIS